MPVPSTEKRKCPRLTCRFVAFYRPWDTKNKADLSQLKNLSLSGALLTTSEYLEKGATVSLKIRLPCATEPVMPVATVVESNEKVKGLIYETRLMFSSIEKHDTQVLSELLDTYLVSKPSVPA